MNNLVVAECGRHFAVYLNGLLYAVDPFLVPLLQNIIRLDIGEVKYLAVDEDYFNRIEGDWPKYLEHIEEMEPWNDTPNLIEHKENEE